MRKYLNIKCISAACCVIFVVLSVLVFSVSATYTVPVGDDLFSFHHPHPTLWSLIRGSCQNALFFYQTWVGTFFSFFLSYLLHPFNGRSVEAAVGNLAKLKAVMFLNAFLFFLALLCLIVVVTRRIAPKQYRLPAYASAAILFGFLNLNGTSYAEVFFWLTPAAVYSMPMITALSALVFFILLREKPKRLYVAAAAVLAFCSGGGVLMIAGAQCYIMLAILVHDRVKTGKWNRPCLFVWCVSFAAALINTLAPGNFLRNASTGGSVRPLRAVLSVCKVTLLELETLLAATPLLSVLIVSLLLGILFRDEAAPERLKARIRFLCLLLPAPLVALFPLQLGNDTSGIAVRGQFVFDLIAFLLLFTLFFFCGQYLAMQASNVKKTVVVIPLLVLLLCTVSYNNVKMLMLPQYGMLRNLANGSYRDYYGEINLLLEQITESDEKDIVVTLPDDLEQYQNFLLSTDPADYINHGLATFTGKNTIRAAE